jgi:hypothetical protein
MKIESVVAHQLLDCKARPLVAVEIATETERPMARATMADKYAFELRV